MPNTIKTSKIIDIRKETCSKVHFVVGGDDFHQVPEAFTLHDTQRHIVGDNHVGDRLYDLLLLTASNFPWAADEGCEGNLLQSLLHLGVLVLRRMLKLKVVVKFEGSAVEL